MAHKPQMPEFWQVPDPLWTRIRPILEEDEGPRAMGRPPADRRKALAGIIFRLRTGCSWKHVPRAFGDDSTLNRYFRRWRLRGTLERIWKVIAEEYQDLAGPAMPGIHGWNLPAPPS